MLESELQHSRGATMRLIHRNTDLDYGPSEELRWILSLTVGTSKSHSRHQQKVAYTENQSYYYTSTLDSGT